MPCAMPTRRTSTAGSRGADELGLDSDQPLIRLGLMEINTDEDPPKPFREGVTYTLGTTDSLYSLNGCPRALKEMHSGAYATKLVERLEGVWVYKLEMGKTKRGATRYVWTVWVSRPWESDLHILTALTSKDAHAAAGSVIAQHTAAIEQRMRDAYAALQADDTTGFTDTEVIASVLRFGESEQIFAGE